MTIYHGDCFDFLPLIPDKSVDLILCDLPFGTTQNKWDSVLDLQKLWVEYKRVAKPNATILLFAQSPFDKILGCSNLPMLKYEWIWEKPKATGFLNAKKSPLKAHENILVFYSKPPIYNPQMTKGEPYNKGLIKGENGHGTYGHFKAKLRKNESGDRFPRSVIKFKTPESEGKTYHPTQKPLLLLEYLIKTYSNEGDLVLDNCAGSLSTGVACENTGRECILMEKESIYPYPGLNRMIDCNIHNIEVNGFLINQL